MTGIRRTAFVATICLVVPVVWVSPAFAARGLTATPSTGLIDRQVVTVDGSGFNGSVEVGVCQAIDDGSPDESDCGGGIAFTNTSPAGDFSIGYGVKRLIFVPSLGRTVNCAIESCVMGAAETSNIAGTATFAPIAFAPGQPDGLIRRRSDGQITGDNIYSSDGAFFQTRIRKVAQGTKWAFALRVQNDGLETDDITVRASAVVGSVSVRYFIGYYDVTADVTGSGFTYPDMTPGEIRPLAVQFNVGSDAEIGSGRLAGVTFTSDSAGSSDTVVVGVKVGPAP